MLTKVCFFEKIQFSATLGRWLRDPVSAAYAIDPTSKQKPIYETAAKNGLAPGLVHDGSGEELLADAIPFLEDEFARISKDAKGDPGTTEPNLDTLRPMIRKRLAMLWSKHKGGDRGGRNRKKPAGPSS